MANVEYRTSWNPQVKVKTATDDSTGYVPIRVDADFLSRLDNLIRSNSKCVCIYPSPADFKYDNVGKNYTVLNPLYAAGSIASYDAENNTMALILDEKYTTKGGFYIPPDELAEHELGIRATGYIQLDETGNREVVIDRLIGFDLIRPSARHTND